MISFQLSRRRCSLVVTLSPSRDALFRRFAKLVNSRCKSCFSGMLHLSVFDRVSVEPWKGNGLGLSGLLSQMLADLD